MRNEEEAALESRLSLNEQRLQAVVEVLKESGAARVVDRLPDMQRRRLRLLHGSLMYRDPRLSGYEAATVIEVVEHLDPPR